MTFVGGCEKRAPRAGHPLPYSKGRFGMTGGDLSEYRGPMAFLCGGLGAALGIGVWLMFTSTAEPRPVTVQAGPPSAVILAAESPDSARAYLLRIQAAQDSLSAAWVVVEARLLGCASTGADAEWCEGLRSDWRAVFERNVSNTDRHLDFLDWLRRRGAW